MSFEGDPGDWRISENGFGIRVSRAPHSGMVILALSFDGATVEAHMRTDVARALVYRLCGEIDAIQESKGDIA